MSEQEILEGNKLISKFMNYDGVDCHNCKYSGYCNWIQCCLTDKEKLEELSYHSSYERLMPVIEKIEQFNNGDFKFSHGRKRNGKYQSMIYSTPTHFISESISRIESIYDVAIKFLKWYNSCQKEK